MSDGHQHFKVEQVLRQNFSDIKIQLRHIDGQVWETGLFNLVKMIAENLPALVVFKPVECKEAGCNE